MIFIILRNNDYMKNSLCEKKRCHEAGIQYNIYFDY